MSGFNMFRAVPRFAVSSLTAALVIAFPVAQTMAATSHGTVKQNHRNTDVEKKGGTYTYLEAGKGGQITGKNVDIEDRSGTLVLAKNGGYVELTKVDIETNDSHNKRSGKSSRQGPAVKATGSVGHTHSNKSGKPSKISLKDGSVTTRGQNSPALQASNGGTIFVDGTKLRTLGNNSDVAQAIDGGKVALYDADIASKGKNANGVYVSGHKSEVSINKSEIDTKGSGAYGVSVSHGGEAVIVKSTITTNGEDSIGLLASDKGTAVVGDKVRISAKGRDSTAVLVDDGAKLILANSEISTKKRDSNGLEVSDRGSLAVIADTRIKTEGDRADGVDVGKGATAIIADSGIKTDGKHADGVVVSGRRSVASITSTSIETDGYGSQGVSVSERGKVFIDKSFIATSGRDSVGVSVSSDAQALVKQSLVVTFDEDSIGINVSKGGEAVIAKSAIVTEDEDSIGINVREGGKALVNETYITTRDEVSVGVAVGRGGLVALSQASISTKGEDSIGLLASDKGTAVVGDKVRISTQGRDSTAVLVDDGAKLILANSEISTKKRDSNGLEVSDRGSLAVIADTRIKTEGDRADGVDVGKGAAAIIKSSSIQTAGNGSDGVTVGARGKVALVDSNVSSRQGTGVDVSGKSKALLKGSEIQGDATGVAIQGGARAAVIDSAVSADDIALSVRDAGSAVLISESDLVADGSGGIALNVGAGAEAYFNDTRLGARATGLQADGAGTRVFGSESSITTEKVAQQEVRLFAMPTPAVGVLAINGAEVELASSDVTVRGDESVAVQATGGNSAILIENASAISAQGQGSYGVLSGQGGVITVKDSTVSVAGDSTAAARVQSTVADPSTASRLVIEGSTLVAAGANATGIALENSAHVSLIDSTVRSTGASLVSTLNQGGQIQEIIVGSGTRLVDNNGVLLQVNRSGEGGSSKVMLDLQDYSVTAGNIIDGLQTPLSGEGGTYVQLGALATFDGYVSGVRQITTKGGNQTLKFDAGSTMDELSIDNHATTSGGTIDNPIIVYGNASVDNATLGGNWTIKGVLISTNGGIIKPGNSVGVISANSINWGPGTVYQAEINEAGRADLMQVTGSSPADISNTQLVISPDNGVGRFRLNHDYTVLTANGGLQGEFTSTDWTGTTYPLIAMNTLYSENAVAVRMGVNEQALNTMGFTPNQRATGFGAASVVGKNASADEAFFSSNPAQAFDQLSGEAHATARSLLFSDLLSTNTLMQSHMRSNLGAGPQAVKSPASSGTPEGSTATVDRPLWVHFNAGSLHVDGDGNAADARRSSMSLMFGGDGAIGGGWRLGAAGAVSSGNFSIDDRRSDGSLSSYTLALYGGNSWDMGAGRLNLLLGGGYTRHDVDTRRNVNVASAQTLRADYHGSTWQMFGDVGYAIPWGSAHNIEPYVNVSWFNQRMDGFNEVGGDAALRSDSGSNDLASYTLGLRSALVFPGEAKAFTVRTNLGWRHASGDRAPTRSMSFAEGAGSAFSISGAPIAKDSLVVGLSAEVSLDEHASMGVSYNGEFGSGVSDNVGSLFLKVRF